jgi:hypothetical protein
MLESVIRQVPPVASLAVQLPVTPVRVGAPAAVGGAGRGSGLGGSGSIGTLEPIGGKPGEAVPPPVGPGRAPGAGPPPGGGSGLESTLSVGAGVKVCARGGGGSGSTVWRPPKFENRLEESQPASARASTDAKASLSAIPVVIGCNFRICCNSGPAPPTSYQVHAFRNKSIR